MPCSQLSLNGTHLEPALTVCFEAESSLESMGYCDTRSFKAEAIHNEYTSV